MGTKQYDSATDLITFSRASGGTFLGSNGLLQTAANNIPRIEYDAAGAVKGLLIEEARTNKAKSSEDWTAVYWGLGGSGFRNNTNSISPAGTEGATRFYTNTNATAYLHQICPGSVGAKTHTVSCWVRSTNGGNDQTFRLKCTHSGVTDFFSDDKTATSEWQRFIFTKTFINSNNSATIAGIVEDSTSSQFDIEVWGMQVEFDVSFASSYIPTASATVTRAADIASIPTSAFGYNDAAGTVLLNVAFLSTNVSNNAGMDLWKDSSTKISFRKALFLGSTGGTQWGLAGIGTNSELFAGSFKENNVVRCNNGTLSSVDTSALIPQGITKLDMSRVDQNSNAFALNGHIKSIQYYPRRLTNAQLQELTT